VAEGIESYVDIGLHPFNHEPRVTPRASIPEEGCPWERGDVPLPKDALGKILKFETQFGAPPLWCILARN